MRRFPLLLLALPTLALGACDGGLGTDTESRPEILTRSVSVNGAVDPDRPTEDDRVFILESVTGPSSTCFCRRVPDLTRFEFVFNFDVDVPDVNADYDIDFSSTFLEAQLPLGDPLLEEGLDRPPYGFFTSELDRDIIYTRTGSSGGVVRFRAAWLAPEAVVERTLGFCGNDFPILYQISFAITDGEGQSDAVSFPLLIFDNSGSQCRLGNRCQPPASGQC